MAQPICAASCIDIAIAESGCQSATNIYCLCENQTYINNFQICAKTQCSPTDYPLLIQWGVGQCASVGISVAVTSDAPASTIIPGAASTTIGPLSSTTGAIASASSPESPSSTTSSDSGAGDPLSRPAEIATIAGSIVAVIGLICAIVFGRNVWIKKKDKEIKKKENNSEALERLYQAPRYYNTRL